MKPLTAVASLVPSGAYYRIPVAKSDMHFALETWRAGFEDHVLYESNKARRDRGYNYHITAINPQETKALRESGYDFPKLEFSFELLGLGLARKTRIDGSATDEAHFAVVSSPELNEFRASLGLGLFDHHVTLGFDGYDVHGVPKGESTIYHRFER